MAISAAALAYIAIASSVAATAVSAYSSYQQGKAQQTAYDVNARMARDTADAEKQKAILAEEQSRERTKSLIGHQRTLYAKAGVDLSSGSPLMTLAETAAEGEEEAQTIRAGGNVAYNQGINQSTLNTFYGQNAMTAGKIGAASTFLSGLAQAGTMYAQTQGGFGTNMKTPYRGRVY